MDFWCAHENPLELGLGKAAQKPPRHATSCVTFSTRTLVSSVTVSELHLRTLSQALESQSKTVFSHLSPHRVAPISTLRTHPTCW